MGTRGAYAIRLAAACFALLLLVQVSTIAAQKGKKGYHAKHRSTAVSGTAVHCTITASASVVRAVLKGCRQSDMLSVMVAECLLSTLGALLTCLSLAGGDLAGIGQQLLGVYGAFEQKYRPAVCRCSHSSRVCNL